MFDMNMIQSFIQSIFQRHGGSTLSKSQILSEVMKSDQLKSMLPFFQQLPDKQNYTQESATQEIQGIAQKQGAGAGSAASKIRSKVGI